MWADLLGFGAAVVVWGLLLLIAYRVFKTASAIEARLEEGIRTLEEIGRESKSRDRSLLDEIKVVGTDTKGAHNDTQRVLRDFRTYLLNDPHEQARVREQMIHDQYRRLL